MIFHIGNYELDIDVEKTSRFYANANRITDGCDCPGCRNYEAWAASCCAELKHPLEKMGIQLDKAAETYVNCSYEDGSVFYGGFYHLCGKIIRGNRVWDQVDEDHSALNESSFVDLSDYFQIAFTEEIHLLEHDFPLPVIQMEFFATIPWVLPEKCDY